MFRFLCELVKASLEPEVDTKSDDSCESARQWYYDYQPVSGKDYKGVREYAESYFADLKTVRANLDQKAEWLLVFGGGAAVSSITYAEGLGVSKVAAIPAIAMFLWGMYLALRARMPVDRSTPMDPKGCLDREDNTEFRDAWIAASLQCASEVMLAANKWKSKLIRGSARLLALGVFLLVLAIAVSALI